MFKHKKFAVSLALVAALALSVPTRALAMGGGMMGGGGGMMGGLLSAMGNMMGSNNQNPAANQPRAPQEPGYSTVGPAKACGGYPSDHHSNSSSGPTGSSHMGAAMGSGHMGSSSQWGHGKVNPGQVGPPVQSSPGTPVPGQTYPSGAVGSDHSEHWGHTSTR